MNMHPVCAAGLHPDELQPGSSEADHDRWLRVQVHKAQPAQLWKPNDLLRRRKSCGIRGFIFKFDGKDARMAGGVFQKGNNDC